MPNSSTASSALSAADAEIADLRKKVEKLMSERIAPTVADLAGRAEDAAHGAVASVRRESERVGHAVREQPLTALAIAAGVGFLLALLVKR